MLPHSAGAAAPGAHIQIGGFGTTILAAGAATGEAYALVEHTLAPGLLGSPPHRHSREDELSYVQGRGRPTNRRSGDVTTRTPTWRPRRHVRRHAAEPGRSAAPGRLSARRVATRRSTASAVVPAPGPSRQARGSVTLSRRPSHDC